MNEGASCSNVCIDNIFSDSDSDDDKSFHGFDIADVRSSVQDATEALLFTPQLTSTPTAKSRPKYDGVLGDSFLAETDVVEKSLAKHNDGGLGQSFLTDALNNSNSDTDSDICGELIGSNFYQVHKRFRSNECPTEFTSDSESSVEGELFQLDRQRSCGNNDDNDSKIRQRETIHDKKGNSKTEQETAKPRGKHRSTVKTPAQLVNENCCTEGCFRKLTLTQLEKARSNFFQEHPTYESQRKMLLKWFDSNQPEEGKFVYSISGLPVCWLAWTKTLGVTARRFKQMKSDYLKGRRTADHGSFANIPYSDVTDKVIRYLEDYFTNNCDYMPNSSNWHLSSTTTKNDVYLEMQASLEAEGMGTCSETTFRMIWKNHFSHVKIPKENRFGKCDHCSNIKEELRTTTDRLAKAKVQEMKKKHTTFVRKERTSYLSRAAEAHQQPHKYFSVAIDGMDQNKTEIPFSKWRHSSLGKAWRLKIHVVGAIIHGRHPIMFMDYQQHAHDSNMTMNVLLQTLWIQRDLMPNIVYIQLDNTYKENKNQYMFAFLAFLVESKIFEKIEVSFLPVGHTHIDVDQMFSRLSVAIARHGAKTYQDLLKLIHTCHTQAQGESTEEGARPQYARMDHIYAIREWIKPCALEIHNLKDFHHFAFVRNSEENCVIDYKPWCSATTWNRETWEPLGPILKRLPEGVPDLILPNFEAVDFNRVEKMVEKCTEKGILNNHEEQLWGEFLSQEREYAESYDDYEEASYRVGVGFMRCGLDDKFHKDTLVYIACRDERWAIDDLKERKRPEETVLPNLREALRTSETYERGEGLLPIYTGSYIQRKETQKEVITNQDISDMEIGMLVALDYDVYDERPLIGEVREKKEDTVVLVWYGGTWTTKWTVAKRREGRSQVEWNEEVPKSAVVLFDFSLTRGGKLRKATVEALRGCYQKESEEAANGDTQEK